MTLFSNCCAAALGEVLRDRRKRGFSSEPMLQQPLQTGNVFVPARLHEAESHQKLSLLVLLCLCFALTQPGGHGQSTELALQPVLRWAGQSRTGNKLLRQMQGEDFGKGRMASSLCAEQAPVQAAHNDGSAKTGGGILFLSTTAIQRLFLCPDSASRSQVSNSPRVQIWSSLHPISTPVVEPFRRCRCSALLPCLWLQGPGPAGSSSEA